MRVPPDEWDQPEPDPEDPDYERQDSSSFQWIRDLTSEDGPQTHLSREEGSVAALELLLTILETLEDLRDGEEDEEPSGDPRGPQRR